MTRPPVGFNGFVSGLTTSWCSGFVRFARVLADRAAGDGDRVGVQESTLEQALRNEGIPPAR